MSAGATRWLALALLLGACTDLPAGNTAAAPATGVAGPDWNPPAVSATRAVQLFEAVCGASLPNFASARQKMAANGITLASPYGTPTVYSATENVSFQIKDGPGFGTRCSMVFASTSSPAVVKQAVGRLGPLGRSDIADWMTRYHGRPVLVLFDPGSLNHLLMLSERK